jgi:broad-specificity NMP kinase
MESKAKEIKRQAMPTIDPNLRRTIVESFASSKAKKPWVIVVHLANEKQLLTRLKVRFFKMAKISFSVTKEIEKYLQYQQ